MNFDTAISYFNSDKIGELAQSTAGIRFLKLRSLSRKAQMEYLIDEHSISVDRTDSKSWLKSLFESDIPASDIDKAILHLYEQDRAERKKDEAQLVNELYKVQSFEWGGLHQNSLEKTIVDNYIKKITSYSRLHSSIENELHQSMRAYVLASWYNHWSSIIIEDIFKDHKKVIPSVGLIKKIDFFINNKPFDLKVTYLPEGYIKGWRKLNGLKPELTLMKQICKTLNIEYDARLPDSILIPDLWQKLSDHPSQKARTTIAELQQCRETILDQSSKNPKTLIRWLYENQGTRRFDSSNRIFLILADKNHLFDSWQLKRAKPLLSERINSYLDSTTHNIGSELTFTWQGKHYTTEAAAIFAIKT